MARTRTKIFALFRCVPWQCDVSIPSCVKRYRKAKKVRGHGEARTLIHCEGCQVGKAHSKRQQPSAWPNGRPLVRYVRDAPLVPPIELLKKARRKVASPVNELD